MRSLHLRAALQHQRPIAVLGQEVRADQPARPGADDDGPLRQRRACPARGIANGGSSCRSTCTRAERSPRQLAARRAADPPRSCRRTGGAACRGDRVPCERFASGRGRQASRRGRGRGDAAGWPPAPRPGSRRFETRRDMDTSHIAAGLQPPCREDTRRRKPAAI